MVQHAVSWPRGAAGRGRGANCGTQPVACLATCRLHRVDERAIHRPECTESARIDRRTGDKARGDRERPGGTREAETPPNTDLSFSVLEDFSRTLEEVLRAWNFPEADRVHFDKESRDFIIDGKPRGARGKGMRAITHAAVTVALLDFATAKQLPHPGFIILDTPLLAYREPEGDEDDLRGERTFTSPSTNTSLRSRKGRLSS